MHGSPRPDSWCTAPPHTHTQSSPTSITLKQETPRNNCAHTEHTWPSTGAGRLTAHPERVCKAPQHVTGRQSRSLDSATSTTHKGPNAFCNFKEKTLTKWRNVFCRLYLFVLVSPEAYRVSYTAVHAALLHTHTAVSVQTLLKGKSGLCPEFPSRRASVCRAGFRTPQCHVQGSSSFGAFGS